MATFNGSRYVIPQLESVLSQLAADDEIVVVDDASTDDTVDVVRSVGDRRIRVFENGRNLGYSRTFERAMSLATREHLFLVDQDDLWPDGRLALMQVALEHADLVVGNVVTFDGTPVRPQLTRSGFVLRDDPSPRLVGTVLGLATSQIPYYGCAMGMTRELATLARPFPPTARELHDGWLGLLGLWTGSVAHVSAPVVRRREHDGNATGTVRSPWKVARGRVWFLAMVVQARRRARRRPVPR
ncbi:MAG: hypothetical protein JWN84_4637 [Nocardioides sp.]|nr:hypothetical protein [Nocardioides sp.]